MRAQTQLITTRHWSFELIETNFERFVGTRHDAHAFQFAFRRVGCAHGHRCFFFEDGDVGGIAHAFKRYEASRLPRTAEIQQTSSKNTWMRTATDPTWVYGYDAWSAPLIEPQLLEPVSRVPPAKMNDG